MMSGLGLLVGPKAAPKILARRHVRRGLFSEGSPTKSARKSGLQRCPVGL